MRSPFVYSPILLLAFWGGWLLYKRAPAMTILCLSISLGYVVIIATWHSWDGGWTWGARLLTPVLPVLGLLIAPVIECAWKRKWVMLLVFFLAATGLSVQIVALLRDPVRTMIDQVATGRVKHEETIYTSRNSWLALQVRSLRHWQPCDLDAYTLRHLVSECPR